MWESRPLPTSFKKPFAAKARRAFCRSVARYPFHLAQPDSFLPLLDYFFCQANQIPSHSPCSSFGPPARRAGLRVARVFWLVARLNGMCPAGMAAFLFMLIWPPPAGADGGLLGAARHNPFGEAPSALPPDDPAGLVVYPHSHGLALKGFPSPTIPRGLRGFCSGSFLASLGDLPARRAMPACAFALNEYPQRRIVGCRKSQI